MNKTVQKWELIKSEPVFESKYLTVDKRTYKLPTGKIIDDYYHLNRPDYVLIVVINDKNEILLEQQYRRGVDEVLYELPAGWINPKETPIQTAIRELEEETGLKATGDQTFEIYPQGSFCSMKAYVALLKVHELGTANPSEDENINIIWMPLSELKEKIKSGLIKEMGLLSALSVLESIK